MARLNNDARTILCEMVSEKAEDKMNALKSEVEFIDKSLDADYKKRLFSIRKKLAAVIARANEEIAVILATNDLQWGEKFYGNGAHNIESILDGDKLQNDLSQFIKPTRNESAAKRRDRLTQDIADLEAKVSKAKQEILLRASLGMKYDEVVNIINGFRF